MHLIYVGDGLFCLFVSLNVDFFKLHLFIFAYVGMCVPLHRYGGQRFLLPP